VKSKASFKGHPLHPALIPFPFAFLLGSLLFDVAGLIEHRPTLWLTGGHLILAGLASGMLAAVPGIIDYLYTVPPKSSGKQRATRHAVGNASALVLFTFAWLLRAHDGTPTGLSLLFSSVGSLALGYAGWLGGTLVTRNLIGVDHRYADAGKWQEQSFPGAGSQTLVVGRADDLEVDQMKLLHVNDRRIVLARTSDGFTAFDDRCSHRGGSLAGGVLVGGVVQCLWHGSQFNAGSGEVACGPAKRKIKTYEVRRAADGELTLVLSRER
jgi:nitrite reductase/ring-hydroxylating ferredoxin subunit/uncharacterized membrane protein